GCRSAAAVSTPSRPTTLPVTAVAWARTPTIVGESHANVPSDSGASVGTTYASTSIPVMGAFWIDCADMAAHHHSVSPGPAHAAGCQAAVLALTPSTVQAPNTSVHEDRHLF